MPHLYPIIADFTKSVLRDKQGGSSSPTPGEMALFSRVVERRSDGDICPSSNHLRLLGALANGVSGPSLVEIKLPFGDASSGAAGWFCA
jgi:hypothetical protein